MLRPAEEQDNVAQHTGLCWGEEHPEIRLIILEFDYISVPLITFFNCNNNIFFE